MHDFLFFLLRLTHAWNLDAICVGKHMASLNFVLPFCQPDTKHTLEDLDVAYIYGPTLCSFEKFTMEDKAILDNLVLE